jgi:predicted anti-sigma-YlaC factor YlaD
MTMTNPTACERARTWLSLRLDAELSQLERTLLDSHLSRCADCAAAGDRLEAVTATIRSTPPQPPPGSVVPRLRTRGSLRAFYAAAGAALATTAALGGVGALGALHFVPDRDAAPKVQRVSAVAGRMSDDLELLAAARVLRAAERPTPGRIVWPA